MVSKWTKQSIVELLTRNDKAVCRAILAIYNLQTEEEKRGGASVPNGMGFNKWDCDCGFLPGLARRLADGETLSRGQIAAGRKRIVKYARQLVRIANKG